MKTEEQRVAEEYKATLSELKSNSKVEINGLTMLAEDNKEYAVSIATCIETELKSSPSKRKLPVLYLIDSICKNFPKSIYVQLFTQNIVSNFCNVFEVSDEKVRKSLHKLRMTWDATKTFPQKKLNAIDERVHEMDPNWPILHKISSASSQNRPNQPQAQAKEQPAPGRPQRQNQQPQQNTNQATDPNVPVETTGNFKRNNTNNGQTHGRRKRPKLLRNNQIPSENVLVMQSQGFIDPNIIQTPHDIVQVHPMNYIDPTIALAPGDQIHQFSATTFMDPTLIMGPADPQIPIIRAPVLNVNPNPSQNQTQPLPSSQEPPLKHLAILESLYGGKQCSNCSLRFDDNNRYDIHLDWHYRQNIKSNNVFARRKWYYPLNLWVQFREINDDLQENNNTDSNTNDLLLPIDEHEVPTAPASTDDEKNICSVCHETFEKFWAEEEEEWRLRNAKQYEDSRVYHPLCLMDMLQTKVAEATT